MTRRIGRLSKQHVAVRAVVALAAAGALFLIGLAMPGQAAGPFPFSPVSSIVFVQKDLCNMGTLGTSITIGQAMSHGSPFFADITDTGRCVSTKSLNAPAAGNPADADTQIDSELFDYATVGTTTGYGTKLMANITRTQTVPFIMSVDATAGAAGSGEVVAGSEVFTYDSKTATSFHITMRAQRNSQAADHNGGNANANQERVYATPASVKTSSVETTLTTAISIGQTMPFNVDVGSTADASSSCTTPVCVLLIDTERFTYTVVDANTFQLTGRGATKTTAAAHIATAKVLAPREPPFELEVGDAQVETGFDADSPSHAATGTSHFICFGTETMEYNPSAAQTVGDGLGGGSDVIYIIARGLDRIGASDECGLITARAKEAQFHVGASIRDATRVQLLGRALPQYDLGPGTTAAAHSPGTSTNSPLDFSRCIGRSDQTVPSGPNPVISRTRCYSRLINPPSPPGVEDGTGPYFVSTNALSDQFTFISESNGTFNDETDGLVVTRLNVFSYGQCIAFGSLHVEVKTTIQADKTAGDTDYGQFRINVWLNNTTCSGTPNYVIGENDELSGRPNGENFSTTPLASDSDQDRDGCTDFREVGGNNQTFPPSGQGQGGQRDPFNPADFYDINHDGAININTDILGTAGSFGGSSGPAYVPYKDRGTPLGPFAWNKRGPNSIININDDILAVAGQFGNVCPHSHPFGATPFGAHPTTVSVLVTSGLAAPFAMSVGTTATFPKSGQLLVDSETLTYNQNAGMCGGGFTPATQFCITARGVTAQHSVNAIVYAKILTTLSAPGVLIGDPAPFAMSVASTANFTTAGHLLLDSEIMTYDQTSVSCPGLVVATQFCITARGVQPPQAAHAMAALVWQLR